MTTGAIAAPVVQPGYAVLRTAAIGLARTFRAIDLGRTLDLGNALDLVRLAGHAIGLGGVVGLVLGRLAVGPTRGLGRVLALGGLVAGHRRGALFRIGVGVTAALDLAEALEAELLGDLAPAHAFGAHF